MATAPQMADLSLGKRLQLARIRTGLTIKDAAGRLDVSRDSLSDYENDRTDPPASFVRRAAEEYDTSADWLLFGASRVKPPGKRSRPSLIPGQADNRSRKTYVDTPLVAAVR